MSGEDEISSASDEKANILIVDDNPKNIIAMKAALAELPINILEATSGEEALKMVLRNPLAVVYLDIQMPDMDGYEVARCMASNAQTSSIPVVFVTAIFNDKKFVEQGYSTGAIDYLSKPVAPYLLVAKTKIFIKLFLQQQRLHKAVEALNELANNDALTGLANRNHFNTVFEQTIIDCLRYERKFALLLLDLDNFKTVNDTLGHDVGDKLLIEVAARLKSCVRASDHLSRLGGDEFTILLTQINSPHEAALIAKKVLSRMKAPIKIGKHDLSISTSIGIAVFPVANKTASGLFKSADIALYRAKESGRNAFEFYSNTLNEENNRRNQIETALHKAVENNELYLLYQPRVSIKTKNVVGFEALARWRSPSLGLVPTDEFIHVAEESGQIPAIGDYLMGLAFKQLEIWQKKYTNSAFYMSVNLSPSQVMSQNFAKNLEKQLRNYAVDKKQIEFELTESFFKGEEANLENVLRSIQAKGFKIAIDDFGTGYSSLSRLKSLPISVLKIDQSFVRDLLTDNNDAAIVRAIIVMAQALQLEVIAEGVETKGQADFLLKNGCQFAQGYYYSKPVSAEEIEALLLKQ